MVYDFAILGGGIIGTTLAYRIKKFFPDSKIILIEKEKELAFHQTGHNSGVIHSGIFYPSNSLKAKLAIRGSFLMKEFCKNYGIPLKILGKLIIANSEKELSILKIIYERGLKNGLKGLRVIGKEEIKEIEPNINAIKAIYVPEIGVTDFKKVVEKVASLFRNLGGEIAFSTLLRGIKREKNYIILETNRGDIKTFFLVTCAGLHSDRVAKMSEKNIFFKIVPFRGEYYKTNKKEIVQHLIYPVPNLRYPFLGVHITKNLNGEIEIGPNAFLSFSREGYKWHQFNFKDLFEVFNYSGFWRLAGKNWIIGAKEFLRTISKKIFLEEVNKILPGIKMEDIEKGKSGIRAQCVSIDGKLIDDFLFIISKNIIHVCNAPSPAATASFAISEKIFEIVKKNLNLK